MILKVAIILGSVGILIGLLASVVLVLLTPITPERGQSWFGEAIGNAIPGIALIAVSFALVVGALVFFRTNRSD